MKRFRERPHQQRLAEPGYTLKQRVPVRKKADQDSVNDLLIAYNYLLYLALYARKTLLKLDGLSFNLLGSLRVQKALLSLIQNAKFETGAEMAWAAS